MQEEHIRIQQRMQQAVADLHYHSDALVYALENKAKTQPLDDNEEAALKGARDWRSLVETGEVG